MEERIKRIRIVQERNPIALFRPHSKAQLEFLAADTKIIAAFAGNRFGKTTSLIVRALIECVPEDFLPEILHPFKRFGFEQPCHGWIVCPSEDKIYDSLFPALRKWAPKDALHKGDVDSAFNGNQKILRFTRGDTIAFKTYKQEAGTLGGAALHWVGYDEPPPREHRDECLTRLADYGGYEMFAMTPLKVNTGWIRKAIYRQRESPEITVVRGSMHDNPTLDQKTKEHILNQYASDLWRRAREHGDFVDMGGLIYPDWERCLVKQPRIDGLDIVVGIDPGIRNAGFAFVAFDDDNTATMFDEGLLQDKTPPEYAEFIRNRLSHWRLSLEDVTFVIDPAARSRSQVTAETVQSALQREGIFALNGQNDVEAGVQQLRTRMMHGRWFSSEKCVLTRDEADEYAAEDREDGKFVPVKVNDHILDACRYVAMHRPYDPRVEDEAPRRNLGWRPDHAPAATDFVVPTVSPPLGAMQ